MTGEVIARQFEFNGFALEKNIEDFTHEDSLIRPGRTGNCANWVFGHIVATRNALHQILGLDPAWPGKETARYERGTNPITDPSEAQPLEVLVDRYKNSQQVLINTLAELGDVDLAKKTGDKTLAEKLAGLSFHESYHIGQLALLRHTAGKGGAIK